MWSPVIFINEGRRNDCKVFGASSYQSVSNRQTVQRSINVKTLIGHSIGVEDSYYRPQEKDISEYKKAIPSLTISSNNKRQTEVAEVAAQIQSKE
jgi:hypothetical protein